MQYDLCRHLKTNGTQCGSPALENRAFCFFHQRLYSRHAAFRHVSAPAQPGVCDLQLSPLEDRDSIQSALSVVIHALASGHLETRRATALFYGLQLASMNAARLNSAPFPPDVVVQTTSGPDGVDLALPGTTRTLTTNISDEVYEEDLDDQEQDEQEDERERAEMEELWKQTHKAVAEHLNPYSLICPPDTVQSTHS